MDSSSISQISSQTSKMNLDNQKASRKFWTMCSSCRMEYEYRKTYLDRSLICSNCCQVFVASEIPPCSASALISDLSNGERPKRRRMTEENSNSASKMRKLSWLETRNMLIDKARREIGMKRTDINPRILKNGFCIEAEKKAMKFVTVTVPESEIFDFDKRRTEKCLEENQVWAVYDSDDGMPRHYAMIIRILSLDPINIRIAWLNNGICAGTRKTSGEFRRGSCFNLNSLSAFSHKVKWREVGGGGIGINPRKGEVWALYRNWSPDWNELTAEEVIHRYDMVEVLEDYRKDEGVSVIPLIKVLGFKAVFHCHLDLKTARMIPGKEMCRFSHQVPAYLITGKESGSAPKGCWELDPAAMPLELLEVTRR